MYSCSSGSCLLKFVSSLRPVTATQPSATVTSAKIARMSLRCPNTCGSSQAAIRCVAGLLHGARAARQRQAAHAALARHDQRAVARGHDRRDRLAVVLLAELEAPPAVAADEHHARRAGDDDGVRVDARAGVEQRRGAGRDRGPGRAAVLRPEQVAAQPEGEHRRRRRARGCRGRSRRTATAARASSRRRRRSGTAAPLPRRRTCVPAARA